MRQSFVLYNKYWEAIKHLSLEDKGKLLEAIFIYQLHKEIPPETSSIYIAFLFIKNQFELDDEKYFKIIERNKINGLKGGRPKGK